MHVRERRETQCPVVLSLDYARGVVVTRHISTCQTMAAGHIPLSAGQDLAQLATVTLSAFPYIWVINGLVLRCNGVLSRKRRVRAVATRIWRRNSGEKHLTDLHLNAKFIMN